MSGGTQPWLHQKKSLVILLCSQSLKYISSIVLGSDRQEQRQRQKTSPNTASKPPQKHICLLTRGGFRQCWVKPPGFKNTVGNKGLGIITQICERIIGIIESYLDRRITRKFIFMLCYFFLSLGFVLDRINFLR